MPSRSKLTDHKINQAQQAIQSGASSPNQELQGTGPPNRHGMPKLPPGQRKVQKWPILDLGIQPDISQEDWTLTLSGEVQQDITLTFETLMALPQVEDVSDFHCVTTWSRTDNRWGGIQFKMLAQRAGLTPSTSHLYITGYDGYSTNLPLDVAMEEDVLLVHTWEGEPITRAHGGPIRMIVPRKYAWKGAKWIKEIIFLPEDRKGYWEERGYSNTADPWRNDRFDMTGQSPTPSMGFPVT